MQKDDIFLTVCAAAGSTTKTRDFSTGPLLPAVILKCSSHFLIFAPIFYRCEKLLPGHDWVPDYNWGGSGMIGLQEMLMQKPDERIFLFPAWPKEWDVDFKLHTPQNRTIECGLENGKITKLKVTPESRAKDLVVYFDE